MLDNNVVMRGVRTTTLTGSQGRLDKDLHMDSTTFDTVTRNLSRVGSRRVALGGLLAGALALTAGTAAPETTAKRRKGKGKKQRALRPGDRCQSSKQCRQFDGDYICGRERIFSDERVCCGGVDALCDETGGQRQCCYGYLCAGGRCIVV